jgi:hypothetical protein
MTRHQAVCSWDTCGHWRRTGRAARRCGRRTFGVGVEVKVKRAARQPQEGRHGHK